MCTGIQISDKMAKSKEESRFTRSFSLPISRVRKGNRRDRSVEERQEDENKEEIHMALRAIKILAIDAKRDFKKKRVYRMHCENLIEKWIPNLKRLLRITTREERRDQEEAEAQEENLRRETEKDLRSFSKKFDQKRAHADEIAMLKKKYEDELAKQKRDYENIISKLKREHGEEEKKYQDEKERLLTRLSQAAGDKLRQNNPAISDLSDPYRPTKLSEMFSELYDNEWTNAMDLMDSDCSEQKAVQTLLRIQLNVFELCKGLSEAQLSSLRVACCGKDNNEKEISTTTDSKLKEMLKEMAPLAIKESRGYKEIWQKLEDNFSKDIVEKCKTYIQKCIECSWFMCVQDPPMHLVVWKSGEEMDNNCMKSFTKLGKFVDFSVWPALYLYKAGPLLSKGIVQGTNNTSV